MKQKWNQQRIKFLVKKNNTTKQKKKNLRLIHLGNLMIKNIL